MANDAAESLCLGLEVDNQVLGRDVAALAAVNAVAGEGLEDDQIVEELVVLSENSRYHGRLIDPKKTGLDQLAKVNTFRTPGAVHESI